MNISRWSNITTMMEYYDWVGFEAGPVGGFDAIGYGDKTGPCRSIPTSDFTICNEKEMVALIDDNFKLIKLVDRCDINRKEPYAEFFSNYRAMGVRRWGFVFPKGRWKFLPNPNVRIVSDCKAMRNGLL